MYRELIRKGEPVLQLNEINGVEYLTFPLLTATGMVRHLFSTRIGGVSKGIYESMNLSFIRGDDERSVLENYRRIAGVMNGTIEDIVCSDQTHTTNIRLVTAKDKGKGVVREKDYQDVDGLITDVPGIILATFYADCVPIYLVDIKRKAIGLAHSGWKGTAGRIGEKILETMGETFGTRAKDVYAAIGPSICRDCYEVSGDVAERFDKLFLQNGKEPGKYQLDLWKANAAVLLEAGILPEHLAITDLCTACNPSYLFSHRASNGKRGNLGAFLSIIEES